MSTCNVNISRRNFMKAGAVAAAMTSLSVPAMAASAEEENCLWSKITPRRSTQYGPVVGLDQGESLVWYGIPYGAAPVGELRWQAPQDPAVWTEAKDCTAPSEVAYQYGSGAIGGAFTGLMRTRSYSIGGLGLFGLPSFIDTTGVMGLTNMIYILIAILIASVAGFAMTYVLYKDEPAKK